MMAFGITGMELDVRTDSDEVVEKEKTNAGKGKRRKRVVDEEEDEDEEARKKARGRPRVDTKDETAADVSISSRASLCLFAALILYSALLPST